MQILAIEPGRHRWAAALILCVVVGPAGCRREALDAGSRPDAGGPGGFSGSGGAGSSGGVSPTESRSWAWSACGTIPAPAIDAPVAPLSARFAPDDGAFAVSLSDGRVLLYALPIDPLARPRELRSSGAALSAIAFSPDGSMLAEIAGDGLILRRVADGSVVRAFDGVAHACWGATARFSPAGDLILYDRCIWGVADGSLVGRLPAVHDATFRDDGTIRVVAIGCAESASGTLEGVCSYDLAGNEISRRILALAGERLLPATTARLAPAGDVVFWPTDNGSSSTPAQRLHAWDTRDGRLAWTVPGRFGIDVYEPVFSTNGDLVLFGSNVATAITHVADGRRLLPAASSVATGGPRALSSNGRLAITDDTPFGLGYTLRETETGASRLLVPTGAKEPFSVQSLAMSGTGELLASLGVAATGWRVSPDFAASAPIWYRGAEGAFTVDISPDGRLAALSGDVRMVFGAADGLVRLVRDVGNSEVPATNVCLGGQMRFSPDGRLVAGKGYNGRIDVFDTTTFEQVASLATASCSGGLAFSRDGLRLATSEPSLFDLMNWSPRWTATPLPEPRDELAIHSPRVDVEISPDGERLLLTTCQDRFSTRCQTAWWNGPVLPGLTARHPRISAEGHWIVSGGTLLHEPSGEQRTFDPEATVAIFAPNGDVVAGRGDGSLARYCRHR